MNTIFQYYNKSPVIVRKNVQSEKFKLMQLGTYRANMVSILLSSRFFKANNVHIFNLIVFPWLQYKY